MKNKSDKYDNGQTLLKKINTVGMGESQIFEGTAIQQFGTNPVDIYVH